MGPRLAAVQSPGRLGRSSRLWRVGSLWTAVALAALDHRGTSREFRLVSLRSLSVLNVHVLVHSSCCIGVVDRLV